VYSCPASQTYFYADKTVQYITSYFEARLIGDLSPNFSNSETEELRFFKLNALPPDLAQINEHWLEDALDKSQRSFVR
jgi:8-oxo-dGTP diphosphatase